MIVYNGGSYDLLHRGHMFVFRQLRAMAGPFGIVVVSLNTDEFIEEFKGHPPVMSYDDRAAVLEGLRDIDQVIPNVGGADSLRVKIGIPLTTQSIVDRWALPRNGSMNGASTFGISVGWTATAARTCGRPHGPCHGRR
jgi:cytidyltransferase-like protein